MVLTSADSIAGDAMRSPLSDAANRNAVRFNEPFSRDCSIEKLQNICEDVHESVPHQVFFTVQRLIHSLVRVPSG